MRQTARNDSARMMTLEQGTGYTGMGRTYFKKWAKEIGARREFSSHLIRYDKQVIDEALDKMQEA